MSMMLTRLKTLWGNIMQTFRRFSYMVIIASLAMLTFAVQAQSWEWEIYAGQHYYVGTLTATETTDGLEVTYYADSGNWCFYATHLYVDSTPPEKIAPGQFNYKHENLDCVSRDTFTVAAFS